VDQASSVLAVFLEPIEVKEVIVVSEEACLPVVAALNDVERNSWRDDTWSSWHVGILAPRR